MQVHRRDAHAAESQPLIPLQMSTHAQTPLTANATPTAMWTVPTNLLPAPASLPDDVPVATAD